MSAPNPTPPPPQASPGAQALNPQFPFAYLDSAASQSQQLSATGSQSQGFPPNQPYAVPANQAHRQASSGPSPSPNAGPSQQFGFDPQAHAQQGMMQSDQHQDQMAMLQEMMNQRRDGRPAYTPEQLQAVMRAAGGNQQAIFQAGMRPPMGPGQAHRGMPGQQQPPMNMGASQGAGASQQQQFNQLQHQQQLQQQQRIQQIMQQQQNGSGMSPYHAHMSSPGAGPSRPPMQQQQSMAPPPMPGNHQNSGQQMPPQQLSLSQDQQRMFTQSRQAMLENPSFRALPQATQQQHLLNHQQQMMQRFASQNGMAPQQHPQTMMGHHQQGQQPMQPPSQHNQQQQQPPPSIPPRPASAQSTGQPPQQSPHVQRQQLPGQTPLPISSLPQHMAPPRPASAASQRAPSPHHGGPGNVPSSPAIPQVASTPPPMNQVYSMTTPQQRDVPSPSASVHSHHSHHSHQTPQQQQQPAPPVTSGSPMSLPPPSTPQAMQQQYQPGPSGMPRQSMPAYQQQIPPGPTHPAMQQHVQNAQNMLQNGQLGGPPQPPSGAIQQMQFQNLSQNQQQQLGTAMNIFNSTAQAQAGARPPNIPSGIPGPPGNPMGNTSMRPMMAQQPRPPMTMPPAMPNIPTDDFPFDWRYVPLLGNVTDPNWRNQMAQRNPGVLQQIQNAALLVQSGAVRPEVFARMQQVALFSRMQVQAQQSGQVRPPGMPQADTPVGANGVSQQLQQQLAQAAVGGFNGAVRPPGAPGQGWPQMMPGQGQPGQSGPRPPPHMATPTGHAASPSVSEVPPIARRASAARDRPRERTPSQSTMPPPPWIPDHGPAPISTPATSRQAPPAAAEAVAGPSRGSVIPVKEWEAHLSHNLPIYSITHLPDEDPADPTFGGKLEPLSDEQKEEMRRYMDIDKAYPRLREKYKEDHTKKMIHWAKEKDASTPWWEPRLGEVQKRPTGRLTIIWPGDKANQRAKTTHHGRREFRFSPAQLKAMKNVQDQVVPVRLEFEHDGRKIVDTILWNCADICVTPEVFAQSFCDDFKLPPYQFVNKIVATINERVREYQDQVLPILTRSPDATRGKLEEGGEGEGRAMYEIFKKVREGSGSEEEIKTESGGDDDEGVRIVRPGDEDMEDDPLGDSEEVKKEKETNEWEKERPMTVEEIMMGLNPDMGEDLRILIKVNIIVGQQLLVDSFEWDLQSSVSPEEYAAAHCRELGLSGEFVTALAHDIHEQILVHQRSLFLVGHTPGSGNIVDDEVRSAFLPPLTDSTVLRREDLAMAYYTPIFSTLTEEDVANIERERERDSKRKKRTTRARRGIALPDREPLKTQRTLINPIGPNGLAPKPVELAPVQATSSRRQAAITAQANINLMANDLPIPEPPSPAPPIHQPSSRGRAGGRGRGGRGISRASPGSAREGSVNGDVNGAFGTPGAGSKRSLREDSFLDGGAGSPLPPPHKRRNNGRIIESPEPSQVKAEASTAVKVEPPPVLNPQSQSMGRIISGNGAVSPSAASTTQSRSQSASSGTAAGERGIKRDREFEPSSRGSDSGSDSDDDDGMKKRGNLTGRITASVGPGAGARTMSATSQTPVALQVSPVSASAGRAIGPEQPSWIRGEHDKLQQRYKDDLFSVVPKVKPADQPDAPQEWRIKCVDCPGKVYTLGPGESFTNFETHLKNRQHVEKRQARTGRK